MTAFNSEFSISHSFFKVIPTEMIDQMAIVDFQLWPDLNDVQINTIGCFSCFFVRILLTFLKNSLFICFFFQKS